MAVIRSRRVRDAGMGGLVQQSAALGADRQHPAGRSRGTLLRHAGTTRHGGVTQTKWPPTNRGRFIGVGVQGLSVSEPRRVCWDGSNGRVFLGGKSYEDGARPRAVLRLVVLRP